MENLITSNGSKFDKANWDCTCQTIVLMFDGMMPKPLQEQSSKSEVCILFINKIKLYFILNFEHGYIGFTLMFFCVYFTKSGYKLDMITDYIDDI